MTIYQSPATYPDVALEPEPDWRVDARCSSTDPEFFFPEHGMGAAQNRAAMQICRGCPVREVCLAEHMDDEFGVFGGTTPQQRRALRKRMEARG